MTKIEEPPSRALENLTVTLSEPGQLCKARLPLYGPLEIPSAKAYFSESKKHFFEKFYNVSPPSMAIEDFNILYTIQQGSCGCVKLVQNKFDKVFYATKIIQKRKLVEIKGIGRILNEKRILQSMDFPFALHMEYFIKDSTNLYFVMPFISGGDLRTLLRSARRFSEKQSRFYAAQVVLALEYLQYLCFVFRDLKPENILIDHLGFVKLTDYGFTKLVESRTYTFCGTPHYLAPEMIQGIGYARSVDWWALGVLVYEMVAGHPPFDAKDNVKLFIKIMYEALILPKEFSDSLQSLLRKLLQRDVTRRFGNLKNGAEDVKNHEWFKKIDWIQLLNRRAKPPFVPVNAGDGIVSNFPKLAKSSELILSETDEFVDEFKDF